MFIYIYFIYVCKCWPMVLACCQFTCGGFYILRGRLYIYMYAFYSKCTLQNINRISTAIIISKI